MALISTINNYLKAKEQIIRRFWSVNILTSIRGLSFLRTLLFALRLFQLLCIKRARKRQTSKLLSSHVRTARKVLTAATERRQFRNSYSDPNTCPLSMLSFVTVKQDRDAAVPSKIPDDELPRILPTELTVDIDSAAALPDNGSSVSLLYSLVFWPGIGS